jgi:hypothetical protein
LNCSAYSNQGDGINASQGNVITNCSVSNSSGNGSRVSTGSTVSGCSVKFITLDAIRCDAECVIRNNNTGYAGWIAGDGAGIHATGVYNHIEGNHCSRGDRGIDVDSTASTIIGNTCAGNAINWSIASNNYYGAIINRAGVAAASVSGDAAASTIAGVAVLNAGPLDPPAGPINGTFRTLAEIEPRTPINSTTCPGDADSLYRITRAGSYYLTGNLTGVSGKSGIEIAVSHVTVDLMGHVLTGVAGSIDGVRVTATTTGVSRTAVAGPRAVARPVASVPTTASAWVTSVR